MELRISLLSSWRRTSSLIWLYCFHLILGTPESEQVIKTDLWDHPVLQAGTGLVYKDKLFLADRFDEKVKVYSLEKNPERPVFLYQTPGRGQGPGEIPSRAGIHGLFMDRKGSCATQARWNGGPQLPSLSLQGHQQKAVSLNGARGHVLVSRYRARRPNIHLHAKALHQGQTDTVKGSKPGYVQIKQGKPQAQYQHYVC